MGLSGNNPKQRIPDDPRNTKWANDTSAPGFRLLSSMGWTPTAPSLGNAESQSLILTGGGSTFSKKVSVIPTAKDNTLGIGARKNGAGIGGIRAMGVPMGSMGFVSASVPGEGAVEEPVAKTGGEFGRLLERLNAAKLAAAAAEALEGGATEEGESKRDKKRKRDREQDDNAASAAVESAPTSLINTPSPIVPLSPAASAPASPAGTILKNPRMAARSKHLRAKRMASSSNAAAMAEILGIAPPSATPIPPPSFTASVLPSSIPAIPFARPSIGQSQPISIAGPSTEGFPEAPRRAFPMFASSAGTGLQATFEVPTVAVIEQAIEIAVLDETEKEKLKREKRERKEAKRSKKADKGDTVVDCANDSPPVIEAPPVRKFPSFLSASTTGLAATFKMPKEVEIAPLVNEEVDEAERKRLKRARKEEKRARKEAAESA
ncbi:hypothetical protein P7C70_g2032, partial [Phenoliferia sp. Uapishka_3]